MEHKKKETKVVDVITDVTCDCCGKSCSHNGVEHTLEYMTLKSDWGYYSNKDLQTWVAHVCESCVDEKFKFVKFQKINSINGITLDNEK